MTVPPTPRQPPATNPSAAAQVEAKKLRAARLLVLTFWLCHLVLAATSYHGLTRELGAIKTVGTAVTTVAVLLVNVGATRRLRPGPVDQRACLVAAAVCSVVGLLLTAWVFLPLGHPAASAVLGESGMSIAIVIMSVSLVVPPSARTRG